MLLVKICMCLFYCLAVLASICASCFIVKYELICSLLVTEVLHNSKNTMDTMGSTEGQITYVNKAQTKTYPKYDELCHL